MKTNQGLPIVQIRDAFYTGRSDEPLTFDEDGDVEADGCFGMTIFNNGANDIELDGFDLKPNASMSYGGDYRITLDDIHNFKFKAGVSELVVVRIRLVPEDNSPPAFPTNSEIGECNL